MENEYIETLGAIASDPDIRDYKIAKSSIKKSFPESFELKMSPVKNQGRVSSCVAHALASTIEYFNKVQHNVDYEMSVGYIYGNRGLLDNQGEGMVTRKAIATVCNEGDVIAALFPFNEEVPDIIKKVQTEKNTLSSSAFSFRFTSYFKVTSEREIKTALMKNGPVIVAVDWYKDMKVKSGVLTSNFNNKSGGHCMVLYGWDERGWKIQNSWGKYWGDNGCCIWPYEYKIREAYSVIDNISDDLKIKQPFKADTKLGKSIIRFLNKIYGFFYRIWYNAKNKDGE